MKGPEEGDEKLWDMLGWIHYPGAATSGRNRGCLRMRRISGWIGGINNVDRATYEDQILDGRLASAIS